MITLNVFWLDSLIRTSLILSLVLFAISSMSILPWGEISSSELGLTSNSQRLRLSNTLLHNWPSTKGSKIKIFFKLFIVKNNKKSIYFYVLRDFLSLYLWTDAIDGWPKIRWHLDNSYRALWTSIRTSDDNLNRCSKWITIFYWRINVYNFCS